MATRRARIKAVASLPARRKNTEEIKISIKDLKSPTGDKLYEKKSASISTLKSPAFEKQKNITVSDTINVNSPVQIKTTNGYTGTIVIDRSESEVIITETPNSNCAASTNGLILIETNEKSSKLDGIIPLNPKNALPVDESRQLNFEAAEVSFDPIVPLPAPSPGKIRPKLKPVPRFGPTRRNSLQGSASESEEDGKRHMVNGHHTPAAVSQQTPAACAYVERNRNDSTPVVIPQPLNTTRELQSSRVRNDSISSSMSIATQSLQASPMKEKHLMSRSKRNESRRIGLKSKYRGEVKRDTLTMYDLIFYNPSTNPIVKDNDEKLTEGKIKEEKMKGKVEKLEKPRSDEDDDEEDTPAPAVQVKLAADGSIIVDESSTVIKTTEQKKRKLSETILHESDATRKVNGRYTSRPPRAAEWSSAETVRFYRALAVVGTDFSMMCSLFPGRNRRDLKTKFKKEERNNLAQVDKALRMHAPFDIDSLMDEFTKEREAEKERLRRLEEERNRLIAETERRKEVFKKKIGRASKTMSEMMPTTHPDCQPVTMEHLAKQNEKRLSERANVGVQNAFKLPLQSMNGGPGSHPGPICIPSAQSVESGSLVVLSIASPTEPNKKIMQTYVSCGNGRFTPVALPKNLLNPVLQYVKNKNGSPTSKSPQSVQGVQPASTLNAIKVSGNISPINKRQRTDSYRILNL